MPFCCHGDIKLHKMKRDLTFFDTDGLTFHLIKVPSCLFFLFFPPQHTLDKEEENAANSI